MQKRLFFGAEVRALWPQDLPVGKLIPEPSRHLTLAFLGNTDFDRLSQQLDSIPRPEFSIAPAGACDQWLFFPEGHPHVAALHVRWFDDRIESYQQNLAQWLRNLGYDLGNREFISHVTCFRTPFDKELLETISLPLPVFASAIHLYESVGNRNYEPLWSVNFLPPFEIFEHTADIAFRIKGTNLKELLNHAQLALAFECPELMSYSSDLNPRSLDEIVIELNSLIALADQEFGTPFKAVSFHGEIAKTHNDLLVWEMIVDV
jgi:2'-5' RNA ligase